MKQKRTFIAVLLVIAVLALGVAFAAQSLPFTIAGTASAAVGQGNFKVAFAEVTKDTVDVEIEDVDATDSSIPTDKKVALELTAASAGAQSASFTLTGFSTQGDKAVITYDVNNTSIDLAATMGTITVTPATHDNFAVSAKYVDADGEEIAAPELAAKTGTTKVQVTVELKNTVKEPVSATTFNVAFKADAK